ncbi:hypothetical protein Z043_115681 [Scleropages formosus]|uniref:Vitamin K-dependent protein C n=1 Tax=Scleropages formosus TaxID=113540 RepID=A0A0P7YGA5_SCLFO|nr:hypothetical protein Z043_115681 [Scleropages formosus]
MIGCAEMAGEAQAIAEAALCLIGVKPALADLHRFRSLFGGTVEGMWDFHLAVAQRHVGPVRQEISGLHNPAGPEHLHHLLEGLLRLVLGLVLRTQQGAMRGNGMIRVEQLASEEIGEENISLLEVLQPGDLDKMLPDRGEQTIRVELLVKHPHFHEYTYDSDIALLYLAQPVQLGPYATPICLPNAHLAQMLLRDSRMGTVTGWGVTKYLGTSSRFLRKVDLPAVDQKKCIQSTDKVITDNMFCAGYLEEQMDACSGDSGGPFVSYYRDTWYLTGVVSWGEGCGTKGKYGVYTRLENFLSWIEETVLGHEENITHV